MGNLHPKKKDIRGGRRVVGNNGSRLRLPISFSFPHCHHLPRTHVKRTFYLLRPRSILQTVLAPLSFPVTVAFPSVMSSVGRPARALFSCRPPALWDKRTQSVGLGHTAACQIQCSRTLSIGTCLTQGPRVSLGQVSGRERSWRRRRAYSSHPASAPPTKEGSEAGNRPKVTLTTLRKLWREKKPMTMLTAYDYPTGLIVDRAGMDMCLVGDSLGMVCLGYDSTTSVTMEVRGMCCGGGEALGVIRVCVCVCVCIRAHVMF